jgi:predicted  nucleic acid-binding Zn-ribbon protein
MDATAAAEARERVTKWIEETRHLFALLPELLTSDPRVNERASAAEKEIAKLKREIEDLKKENHQLRGEKDEITQAMGQIAQKLGLAPRKSPFERSAGGEPPPRPGEQAKPGDQPKAADHPKS